MATINEDTMDYELEAAVGADDFFSAPELVTPSTPPEAHRAVITGVTAGSINDNWTKLTVGLVSRDIPTVDQKLEVLLPKAYTDSIGNGHAFDPKSLAPNAQKSYSIGVANSDKNATLQELVTIGIGAGRKVSGRPTDFDSYATGLNDLLSGLEVIMLLREKGGDDSAFKHNLIAKRIVPADAYETSPKMFRKYTLAWENA